VDHNDISCQAKWTHGFLFLDIQSTMVYWQWRPKYTLRLLIPVSTCKGILFKPSTLDWTFFFPGDGQLSYVEFENHAADNPVRHEVFNRFDTNKDGFLQKAETDAIYAIMDKNGTSKLVSFWVPMRWML
jgi:hypothetical protein